MVELSEVEFEARVGVLRVKLKLVVGMVGLSKIGFKTVLRVRDSPLQVIIDREENRYTPLQFNEQVRSSKFE